MRDRVVFWTPSVVAVGLVIAMFLAPAKPERHPRKEDLKDTNPAVRAWALRRLEDEQALTEALHDEDPDMRCIAATYVRGEAGSTKGMIALLMDDHIEVRRAAAFSLGWRGPAALAALEEASQDENPQLRAAVAHALPDVYWFKSEVFTRKSVLSMLEKLAKDEDPEVRSNAEDAIKRFRE